MGTRKYLVIDANVLIDYIAADRTILALASQHLGIVHVPRTILDEELPDLTEDECRRLGIVVVDETVDQLVEAGAGSSRGALSFEDRLCLILARDGVWTCVSNDGALRRECAAVGVEVRWGLQLMQELVAIGQLSAEGAIDVANAIHKNNPKFIPQKLVNEFSVKVRELERRRD
jgi:predicted nucleic acid-binding protein